MFVSIALWQMSKRTKCKQIPVENQDWKLICMLTFHLVIERSGESPRKKDGKMWKPCNNRLPTLLDLLSQLLPDLILVKGSSSSLQQTHTQGPHLDGIWAGRLPRKPVALIRTSSHLYSVNSLWFASYMGRRITSLSLQQASIARSGSTYHHVGVELTQEHPLFTSSSDLCLL